MKKMIFVILVIIAIAVIATLLQPRPDKDLAQEIETLLENGETTIDLKAITDFEWTQVEVFGPYTSDEVIEDTMGIKFRGDNGGIDYLDSIVLLVFADEMKDVKTVVLSRKYGSYSVKENEKLSVE